MIEARLVSYHIDVPISPVNALGSYAVEYVNHPGSIARLEMISISDGIAALDIRNNQELIVMTKQEYLEMFVNKEIMTE